MLYRQPKAKECRGRVQQAVLCCPPLMGRPMGALLTSDCSTRASLIKRPGVLGVRTCGLKRKEENPVWRLWREGRREAEGFTWHLKTRMEGVPNKSCQNNEILSLLSQKGVLQITLGLKFLWQELLQVYVECQYIKLLIKTWVSFQMMERREENVVLWRWRRKRGLCRCLTA